GRPVPAPEQLVLVQTVRAQGSAATAPSNFVSFPDYEHLRDHLQSFTGLAALNGGSNQRSLVPSGLGRSDAIRARASDVTGNYFSVLQAARFMGRLLQREVDRCDAPRSVGVMS